MLNVHLTTFHFTTLMSKDEIKFIYFLLNRLCLLVSVSLSWVTGPWSKRQAVCAHCVSFHAELTIRQIMLVPTASFALVWVKDLPKIKLNLLCTEQKCDQIMQKRSLGIVFFSDFKVKVWLFSHKEMSWCIPKGALYQTYHVWCRLTAWQVLRKTNWVVIASGQPSSCPLDITYHYLSFAKQRLCASVRFS